MVAVRFSTPEGHPTEIRSISPTQPMRQPQWEAFAEASGDAPPYLASTVPIPMTPSAVAGIGEGLPLPSEGVSFFYQGFLYPCGIQVGASAARQL